MVAVKRALVSVSDKQGLLELVAGLQKSGGEILSTGGTFKAIQDAGLAVKKVSEVTGFPEILDGRVKTLHPAIHGGILARRVPEHLSQLEHHGIAPIDLVVVNLYPFEQTIARPGTTREEAIENIDIGGPTMIRAAAKNHAAVVVVVDPADYPRLLAALEEGKGTVSDALAAELAAKAFAHTARYDAAITKYLSAPAATEELPAALDLKLERLSSLRYGENPHQRAALYGDGVREQSALVSAEQLQGKELSFNNYQDGDAALTLAREFEVPTVVAVKHANPCGVGTGPDLITAFRKAHESDPVSIFGGIVAVNRPLDGETAAAMADIFLEVILAPDFSPEARERLAAKKNLRLLKLPVAPLADRSKPGLELRRISGGWLAQESDIADVPPSKWQVVTRAQPTPADIEELLFAWKVVRHVKSNAIVLAKGGATVGVGAGQMNRVGAARIAVDQAGPKAQGSYLGSDAFFPMPDTVELAAQAGVRAIIQPGGSMRDGDSIAAADRLGLVMILTGQRHFRH